MKIISLQTASPLTCGADTSVHWSKNKGYEMELINHIMIRVHNTRSGAKVYTTLFNVVQFHSEGDIIKPEVPSTFQEPAAVFANNDVRLDAMGKPIPKSGSFRSDAAGYAPAPTLSEPPEDEPYPSIPVPTFQERQAMKARAARVDAGIEYDGDGSEDTAQETQEPVAKDVKKANGKGGKSLNANSEAEKAVIEK